LKERADVAQNTFKKIYILCAMVLVLILVAIAGGVAGYNSLEKSLPKLITVNDYQPLLVSQVYDRNGKKIGEFFRERRILIPYEKIPKNLVHAFLAAEDDQFFKHGGLNYLAILRATLANLRAGKNVQGASTITQQVAKTLLLTSEKTYLRKIKEAILAQKMEEHLSKEEILYLYLNQIYFGQGAYGVVLAAETYFRKPVDKLTLAEMAILAGLPKAPSAYSPVHNSVRAKERQVYVLNRMAEVGFISKDEASASIKEPVRVYLRENYKDAAPFFLETVRQLLVSKLGEEAVLDHGLSIETSLDLSKQAAAQDSMVTGLKELDKRQGYRGALSNTTEPKAVGEFLLKTRNKLIIDEKPERIILPDGKFEEYGPLNLSYDVKKNGFPMYLKAGKTAEGIVSKVDDQLGLVYVKVAELEGLIDIDSMQWARKPNAEKRFDLDRIQKPSQALKVGDIVLVKVIGERFGSPRLQKLLGKSKKSMDLSAFIGLELDQDPISEAALLSLDQDNQDILAMIGGTNFEKSEYNRALQAARQTGSSFKSIVYASALDHGYTPSSLLMDAPVVFEEGKGDASKEHKDGGEEEEGDESDSKIWKPANHSKTFGGDITFRNALVKSLNVPAVKVIEDVGVNWAAEYAHRLGIFSPLNMDFTLVLGSSSVTLYEMTKVFSEFGRMGKKTRPVIIHKVQDSHGTQLLDKISLDERFTNETSELDKDFDDRRTAFMDAMKVKTPDQIEAEKSDKKKPDVNFFFSDPDQLIKPTTAYLITSLLKGVVEDPWGTGARARLLGREVAGKTGTTNGYYDGWFLGYTAQIATGVWVGFDQQRTLGKGEVGGRAALPIWLDYMKAAHENLAPLTFPVPSGIVFVNIDADSGQLPAADSKRTIRQAFLDGTEPTTSSKSKKEEDTDFYKQDLSE
jgi:penicillin-binding protein 1A